MRRYGDKIEAYLGVFLQESVARLGYHQVLSGKLAKSHLEMTNFADGQEACPGRGEIDPFVVRQVAEQVKSRGEPSTLRPMSAYERRIIHLTLADHPDVSTESIGQGESRRVVVTPKGQ